MQNRPASLSPELSKSWAFGTRDPRRRSKRYVKGRRLPRERYEVRGRRGEKDSHEERFAPPKKEEGGRGQKCEVDRELEQSIEQQRGDGHATRQAGSLLREKHLDRLAAELGPRSEVAESESGEAIERGRQKRDGMLQRPQNDPPPQRE